jgi:hypothetical protein
VLAVLGRSGSSVFRIRQWKTGEEFMTWEGNGCPTWSTLDSESNWTGQGDYRKEDQGQRRLGWWEGSDGAMCIKYLRYHHRVLMICEWVVEPLGFYAATNEQKGWERGWRTSRALVDSQIQESREEHALIDLFRGTEDEGSWKAESWKTAHRPRRSLARCKSDDEEVTVTELGRQKSGAAQKDKSWTNKHRRHNYQQMGSSV